MKSLSSYYVLTGLLAMVLVGPSYSQAPTNDDYDVVILNEGGIARGRILEIACGDHVTLEVLNGETIMIDYDRVRLITDKQHYEQFKDKLRGDCVRVRRVEYDLVIRIGSVFGSKATHFLTELVIGPKMSRNFYCGLGLGWESLSKGLASAQLHTYIFGSFDKGGDGSNEFFLHFCAGYAHNVTSSIWEPSVGGPKFSLTLGKAFGIGDGAALMLEAGYYYQYFERYTPDDASRGHLVIATGVGF